jgi:hypothetical protein
LVFTQWPKVQSLVAYPWLGRQVKSTHRRKKKANKLIWLIGRGCSERWPVVPQGEADLANLGGRTCYMGHGGWAACAATKARQRCCKQPPALLPWQGGVAASDHWRCYKGASKMLKSSTMWLLHRRRPWPTED